MASVGAVVDAVFGSYDVKNAKQWRDEDLRHREQQKQWREDAILREYEWRKTDLEREARVVKLETEKLVIDARLKQLRAISQLSALLAGFTMCSLIELNIPDDISHPLLVLYGTVCCLELVFMLLCMLTCTLLLLALTRFVTHTLEGEVHKLSALELDEVSPFYDWWLKKCEREWVLAYQLFRLGASFFLLEVALLGWMRFSQPVATAIIMSVLSAFGILYSELSIASRWRYLVTLPEPSRPASSTA
ncbi:hypothetical protein BBJ28_00001881 [Nothophytophthora sp. Chile5]|nr:hypothetical protein BBJ28_00001881 [Nothophytophthora sp. Chile5]